MPKPVKKKKRFINKKEATTYRLIPGYTNDENNTAGQETVDEVEARKEEQRNYGIFFDDAYNYMKHLRPLNEQATLVESFHIDSFSETQSNAERPPVYAEHFSTDVNEDEDIDADIIAALEDAPVVKITEDSMFDDDVADTDYILDDDFITQAGGAVPVAYEEVEESSETEFSEEEEDDDDDDDSDNRDGTDDTFDSDEESIDASRRAFSQGPIHGRGNIQDDIAEAQTALILKNFEEGFGFQCSAQVSDDGEKPDFENLKQILKDDRISEKTITWSDFLDDPSEKPKIDVNKYLYEDEDEYEWKEVGTSKPKFDCMSILSLNSNTRNLPTDILPPRSEGTKRNEKAGQDKETSSTSGVCLKQIEEEMRKSQRADKACTFRPKDETSEEKKARKKAIKDERKERRMEKKANKELFAMEREKMKKETAAISKSVKSIQIC